MCGVDRGEVEGSGRLDTVKKTQLLSLRNKGIPNEWRKYVNRCNVVSDIPDIDDMPGEYRAGSGQLAWWQWWKEGFV